MPTVNALSALRLGRCSREKDAPLYIQGAVCSINPADFSKIIHGYLIPTQEQAERIAMYFDREVSFLWPSNYTPADFLKELSGKSDDFQNISQTRHQ